MNNKDLRSVIEELGYELPNPPVPKGAYLPVRRYGGLIYTSGTGCNINGIRYYTGKVGADVSLEDAEESARIALLNNIANIYASIGDDIWNITVLKLTGYVSSAPDFIQQAKVIDAASVLLFDILGENGRHARSAIGVASLPFDLSVEIELVAAVSS